VFAGCGEGDGASVEGPVTVYASLPLSGPRADAGRTVADGVQLAYDRSGGEVEGVEVRLEIRDDAAGAAWSPAAVGANARAAAQDSSTAAYIGELDSEPTRTSLPITNEAEILQVSPGAGATDLTGAAEGYPDSPDRYRPSGEITFTRLVAGDDQTAAATADLAIDEGMTRVRVPAGEGPYEKLVLSEFETAADEVGLGTVRDGPADAELRIDPEGGFTLLPLSPGAQGPLAVRPQQLPYGQRAIELPVATGDGVERRAEFAAGFESMDLVLQAIGQALADEDGDREFRRRVTEAVLGMQRTGPALGEYSISDTGEPTLCPQTYVGGAGILPAGCRGS
jgi:Periplasmic binding protein